MQLQLDLPRLHIKSKHSSLSFGQDNTQPIRPEFDDGVRAFLQAGHQNTRQLVVSLRAWDLGTRGPEMPLQKSRRSRRLGPGCRHLLTCIKMDSC